MLHAPLLVPPVEPRKKPRVGPWVTLVLVVAVGVGGFVFRGPLAVDAALATDWARHRLPSDFAERPRLAWDRVQELAGQGVSRVRALIPSFDKVQPPTPTTIPTPSSDKGPSSVAASPANENAGPSAAPPEIAFSALPPAAPPPRPALRARSSAASLQDAPPPDPPAVAAAPVHLAPAAPVAAPARAAIPAPEPAPTYVAPAPVSAPAPEPGSLDDLIRKTVERESHQKH